MSDRSPRDPHLVHAVTAGVICGVVGWSSAFAVVLTGLRAVGASPAQAASGLMVVTLTMGVLSIAYSARWRLPIVIAWSTPGAALLAGSGTPTAGFAGAVLAFIVAGLLIALCGLLTPLERLVESIPASLAGAMLAGVLLPLCLAPVRGLVAAPATIAPVVLTWLVMTRMARRWAVPAALVVAAGVIVVTGALSRAGSLGLTSPVLVAPALDVAAAVAIGVPLFLVTMTSQNISGMAVLASFGYRPRLSPILLGTGLTSVIGAFAGGHGINLAAISAALAAGEESHPDTSRRWIAGLTSGVTVCAIAPFTGAVVALVEAAPDKLVAVVAGLALIPAFTGAVASAWQDPQGREAAALTFLVASSGIVVAGVGSAFWGLIAGGVMLALTHRRATA